MYACMDKFTTIMQMNQVCIIYIQYDTHAVTASVLPLINLYKN